MKSVVSVVIPTYNRARDLGRALRSVMTQTYPHWEVLIVDNHSRDRTDDVVRSFNDSRIKLFKIHNDGVIAASRNLGIHHAQGKYIAFLDSDDWWLPKKLEISVRYLEHGYDVCFHGLCGVKHEKRQVFKKWMKGWPVSKPVYADLINKGNAISTSSVVVRTELLRQVGGQSEDPALIAAEDYDCWLRISRVTERFVHVPMVLGYYWMGGGNISNAKRSLVNLKRLRSLHIEPYVEGNHVSFPIWWEYSYARAMYLTGEMVTAQALFKQLTKRSMPWVMLLKVFFMLATTWKYSVIK